MKGFLGCLVVVVVLLAGLCGYGYWRYYYPFGEGVKNGELNYVVRKGILFKTYEGKMIQSGFQSNGQSGIQSNEFIFSIEDDSIARFLMEHQGAQYQLHYVEYNHTLPWRGYSRYVVDSVLVD